MSRLVYVCDRDPRLVSGRVAQLRRIDHLLAPDNIDTRPMRIETWDGISFGLLNPTGSEHVRDGAVGLGTWLPGLEGWHAPHGPVPEGSFVLVRADSEAVEICTDMVASRTLWYAVMGDAFLISSSQRALVMLLGSFQANQQAFPWMLSTASLGPGNGWDPRLTPVPPASRVRFNRRTGHVSVSPDPREQPEGPASSTDLADVMERVFANLEFDFQHWVLPISGGVDSRGLLCYLPKHPELKGITWGLRSSLDDPRNDAFIAREVAKRFGIQFRYFELDGPGVDPARVLKRFIALGEGRVAHLSGYTDGFALWKTLHEAGILGIIRGDHLFGAADARTEAEVRHSRDLTLLSDLLPPEQVTSLELPQQTVGDELARQPMESLSRYRDRLNRQFRQPTIMAALNDLKTPYVEVTNPLLSASLIEAASRLADAQRADKQFWRDLVNAKCPGIPFAERSAIGDLSAFLSAAAALEVLRETLRCGPAASLLSPSALALAEDSANMLAHPTALRRSSPWVRRLARRVLPNSVRALRRARPPRLRTGALAFHSYVIIESCRMLSADAQALAKVEQ